MRCTSCTEPIRPVVALDIDGTLGDYHSHFHRFASMYLGKCRIPVPGHWQCYDGSEPHREWFCRYFGVDERTFRDIKLAYRQGAQKRSMPVFTGARELLTDLFMSDVEVWLTTTRPYMRLDNVDPDTRFWLQRNDIIPYYGLLYDEDKYKELAQRVEAERVVAVLDDLPEQCVAASEAFGPRDPMVSILRYNGYNKLCKWPAGYPSVQNLHEAREVITHRLLDWRAEHEYQRSDKLSTR